MANKLVFNPITGEFDTVKYIQQVNADPSAPPQEAWVTKTGSGSAGTYPLQPIGPGFFMFLTYPAGGASTYKLKYRTKENTTVEVALT